MLLFTQDVETALIYLASRDIEPRDLPASAAIRADRHAWASEEESMLLEMWKTLLVSGAARGVVVEDRTRPRGNRIVGFNLTAFATSEFVQSARRSLPPYVGRQFFLRWQSGEAPVLKAPEIRNANSLGDLNLLILHHGAAQGGDLTGTNSDRIYFKLSEALIAQYSGYWVNEILAEFYDPGDIPDLVSFGLRLRTDYSTFVSDPSCPEKLGCQPFLVGVTRAEAGSTPGCELNRLLTMRLPPRFGFKTGEQDIVRVALRGDTDDVIAEDCRISPWTVKKRWQSIYARVQLADPDLLETDPSPNGNDSRVRRRLLMAYIREHPEELTPINPISANAKTVSDSVSFTTNRTISEPGEVRSD